MTLPSTAQPAPLPSDDPIAALDATVGRARESLLYRERLRDVRVRTLDDLRAIALTTRADLQRAGLHGTRAVPLAAVCHYGETTGTSGGGQNSTWLTAGDLARSARAIRADHPDVFAPGRILLNRFPFMAAPAHLVQLVGQEGGGAVIPGGNINWDVPFPRALELARRTGAQVLAGLPLEPVVLEAIARTGGVDVARDLAIDTLFLGGAPLPPAMQQRLARIWQARVIELYGSTETMLLGTSCAAGTLHLQTDLVYGEVLEPSTGSPAEPGGEGTLVVTTLGLEGSPLVRFDTGDLVRLNARACVCGSPRPGIVVLGRAADVVDLGGRRWPPYTLVDAGAAAADAQGSAVFFLVVLPDRLLVRIEGEGDPNPAEQVLAERLAAMPIEVELVAPGDLLDVELLARSPHVYKPVVLSDWRQPGRRVLTLVEGMIEWPRPSWSEGRRWLGRALRSLRRRRQLGRALTVAGGAPR